jgi:hypothetical protein
MNERPTTIYLQWHGDSDDLDEPIHEDEVTWCRDRIFDGDIEYIRADAVRAALGGHQCSKLFGEAGLIAATMRDIRLNVSDQAMASITKIHIDAGIKHGNETHEDQ